MNLKDILEINYFFSLGVFFFFFLSIVTYFSILQNAEQLVAQKDAHEHIRAQWDDMEASNPHSAAHYGTYAFKPLSVLNSIDDGVNTVTGNVLRLEGHRQNDIAFSESSQSLVVSKFGKLKPALVLQFIIPLLLIFLSFSSYTSERSSGRLKLLLVQGLSLRKIVFAKSITIWFIGLIFLTTTIIVQLIFVDSGLNEDVLSRLIYLLISFSTYYFILVSLTISLSVLFKNSTSSLSLIILIWVLWTIFLPTIA